MNVKLREANEQLRVKPKIELSDESTPYARLCEQCKLENTDAK